MQPFYKINRIISSKLAVQPVTSNFSRRRMQQPEHLPREGDRGRPDRRELLRMLDQLAPAMW
jgi:hypothetical protein